MVERREREEGPVVADGLDGSLPPEVFATGRVCVEADCQVQLSRYNSTPWCALHESPLSTERPFDTSRRRGRPRNSSRRRRAGAGAGRRSAA